MTERPIRGGENSARVECATCGDRLWSGVVVWTDDGPAWCCAGCFAYATGEVAAPVQARPLTWRDWSAWGRKADRPAVVDASNRLNGRARSHLSPLGLRSPAEEVEYRRIGAAWLALVRVLGFRLAPSMSATARGLDA